MENELQFSELYTEISQARTQHSRLIVNDEIENAQLVEKFNGVPSIVEQTGRYVDVDAWPQRYG